MVDDDGVDVQDPECAQLPLRVGVCGGDFGVEVGEVVVVDAKVREAQEAGGVE